MQGRSVEDLVVIVFCKERGGVKLAELEDVGVELLDPTIGLWSDGAIRVNRVMLLKGELLLIDGLAVGGFVAVFFLRCRGRS